MAPSLSSMAPSLQQALAILSYPAVFSAGLGTGVAYCRYRTPTPAQAQAQVDPDTPAQVEQATQTPSVNTYGKRRRTVTFEDEVDAKVEVVEQPVIKRVRFAVEEAPVEDVPEQGVEDVNVLVVEEVVEGPQTPASPAPAPTPAQSQGPTTTPLPHYNLRSQCATLTTCTYAHALEDCMSALVRAEAGTAHEIWTLLEAEGIFSSTIPQNCCITLTQSKPTSNRRCHNSLSCAKLEAVHEELRDLFKGYVSDDLYRERLQGVIERLVCWRHREQGEEITWEVLDTIGWPGMEAEQ